MDCIFYDNSLDEYEPLLSVAEHLKHTNGDARIKKNSVTDSMHSKTRFSDDDEDKR